MQYQNNPMTTNLGGSAISIGTPLPTAAISPLDQLSKDLEASRARIYEAAQRVRQIADTLFGEVPQTDAAIGKMPMRSGKFGSLNDQADAVSACVTELENQLSRLATIS